MRIFLFILGVFAAVVSFEKPAAARNNAWCAYLNFLGGATNCGFSTYQQCLAALSGNSESCGPNPQYQGGAGPAPSRRVRHHTKKTPADDIRRDPPRLIMLEIKYGRWGFQQE